MAVETRALVAEVAALSEEIDDLIIPSGETWEVFAFTGAAAYLDDTAACLIWDPAGANKILACTHGDGTFEPIELVAGDGAKVLRISLQNDTNTARVLGGDWKARRVS